MGGCSPGKFGKHDAIWCILKCILIKFQGKNSWKISVFIATTMKKAVSCYEEAYRDMLSAKILKIWCNLVIGATFPSSVGGKLFLLGSAIV